MNGIGFGLGMIGFPLAMMAACSAALFTVIYLAVRFAIRHERRG